MKHKIKMPATKKSFFERIKFVIPGFGFIAFLMLGVLLVLAPAPVFSASKLNDKTTELTEKEDEMILSKTNDYYNKGLYLKAVDEINIAIEYHQDYKNLPDNIKLMGEASYYAWINALYKNSRTLPPKTYNKVILYITLHPESYSTRIANLIEEIYVNEKAYYETERIRYIEKDDRVRLNKILNKIYKVEQNKRDLDDVINGKKSVNDIKRAIQIEKDYQRAQHIKMLMITLYILIFTAIVVLIILVRQNHKKTIEAQKQFETTMKVVAILQKEGDNGDSPYNPLKSKEDDKDTKLQVKTRRRLGLTDFESEKIAVEYFENEDAKKEFLSLQNQCIELGDKIDHVTGRKRNSKKVSELVFKLCKAAGVDDELSLIYYCAAMVYDAGFLAIPKNILQGEHLTIKERYEVRSHVQKANEYFDFIPEGVRRIFLDAAEFHHENMDGKGYLAGLSNTKIPLIARFIRVAESYISLVNSRSYKKIMDTDSALSELGKKGGIYDPKILNLLEKVI